MSIAFHSLGESFPGRSIDWPNFAERCLCVTDTKVCLHWKPPAAWGLKEGVVRGARREFRKLGNGESCTYFANI